jgi:hypothetical protein
MGGILAEITGIAFDDNYIEFIDYFSIRFSDMPPIMPPHVFP